MATTAAIAIQRQPEIAPPRRGYQGAVFAVVLGIAIAGTLAALTTPHALGVLIMLAFLVPLVLAMPIRGLQVLLVAAIAIEMYPLQFPDSFTDHVPFFENLNNSLGGGGISATPAELLMGLTLVLAFARATPEVRARLYRGRMFVPYLIFLGAVLMGEVHGLMNGGDFNKSLWELRPQIYGFIAFVAATLLIRNRDDILALAVIAAAAIVVKGVVGDVRYFLVLNHNLGAHETVLGHEDSYFLALLPMATIATLIWTGWTRTVSLLALLSLVALAALLANERRAGMAALGGGIVTIALLAIRFHATRRKRILVLTIIAVILAVAFLIVFWNVQNGLVGQFVRPVRSQFDPTYRDYLSNIYRQAENLNLQLSFQTNRVIGMGFGMPFLTVLTQADISNIYPLWNYIPHNTLLWVGVRMGMVGSVAFWGLFGTAILEVCRSISVQRDRVVLVMVTIAGAAVVSQLFVAYADLQLESYRNMIFVGMIFGFLNIVPALFPEPPAPKRTHA